MSEAFEQLLKLLGQPEPDYQAYKRELKLLQTRNDARDEIDNRVIYRLILALEQFSQDAKQASQLDVAVLLRQVIRMRKQSLPLHPSWWQFLKKVAPQTGLHYLETDDMQANLLVEAGQWTPQWLPNSDDYEIDLLQLRRTDKQASGDGLLYSLTEGEFTNYQSIAQKVAVQACLFAPLGSVTLVTLPTGAGKSLCTLLPAWQASEGGTIKGGTTLVIVPTVSLALDQERQAQRRFTNAPAPEYQPLCYIGDTDEETKLVIKQGLLNGTLPLLFTSPEAIMNGKLGEYCIEAARRGTLNRLIIDEAHLVETWGAGFRAEFQFLAAYHQKLLEETNNQLQTILLSATVSSECENLLSKLFRGIGSFRTVQANRLRPEPAYWFSYVRDEQTRQSHVLEALAHLPRPVILYVTQPSDAEAWLKRLKLAGYLRVGAYTGQTDGPTRLKVSQQWHHDQLDIMVANSAFGLGVDKGDIRTIIHACLPENVGRFYQEIGRSGRDGYSAVSLLCVTKADEDLPIGLTSRAVITSETAIERWRGMWQTVRFVGDRGDMVLLDIDAPPFSKPEMLQSEANRGWNEHTLLLLQRAGLIRIDDIANQKFLAGLSVTTNKEVTQTWFQISLLQPQLLNEPADMLKASLEPHRLKEREVVDAAFLKLQTLAREYAKNNEQTLQTRLCLAQHLAELYPNTELACGGCPTCRQQGQLPYSNPLRLDLNLEPPGFGAAYLHGDLKLILGARSVLNVSWLGQCDPETLIQQKIGTLLVELVRAGFQQLILPDELGQDTEWQLHLLAQLSRQASTPHFLLNEDWFYQDSTLPFHALPTVIVYPTSDYAANRLFQVLQSRYVSQLETIPLVNFIHESLYLESENGLFQERVNGTSHTLSSLQSLLSNLQLSDSFKSSDRF